MHSEALFVNKELEERSSPSHVGSNNDRNHYCYQPQNSSGVVPTIVFRKPTPAGAKVCSKRAKLCYEWAPEEYYNHLNAIDGNAMKRFDSSKRLVWKYAAFR